MGVLFGSFAAMLLAGIPIAIVLGLCCVIWLFTASSLPSTILAMRFISGIENWTLLAIPLFVLSGNLMEAGGITDRMIRLVNSMIGFVRGGLALANVGVCMLMAGVSGTAVGDAASVGSVMIPAMKKEGYRADYAAAITAAASVMGPIIPPSLPMVLTAVLLNLSVGKLFLAGIFPGLLMGAGMMVVAYIIAVRQKHPKGEKPNFKEFFVALIGALIPLMMPVLIIVGIVGGIFTPTEAAGSVAALALVIGIFLFRTLKVRDVPKIVLESMVMSVPIMVLVGCAQIFSWITVAQHVPEAVANVLLGLTSDKNMMMLYVCLLLLFIGTFMETLAAMMIMFPILFTLVPIFNFDPHHFAFILVFNLMIGLLTPPLGVCLFVASSIARVSLGAIVIQVWPFLLVNVAVLFLTAYVPEIVMFLPNLLMPG